MVVWIALLLAAMVFVSHLIFGTSIAQYAPVTFFQ
jgi:hypothetical protein